MTKRVNASQRTLKAGLEQEAGAYVFERQMPQTMPSPRVIVAREPWMNSVAGLA